MEGDKIKGVHTEMGGDILSRTVILTNGTFLNGKIYIGEKSFSGGRISEADREFTVNIVFFRTDKEKVIK